MYSEYSDFSNISPEGNFCDYEKLKRFLSEAKKEEFSGKNLSKSQTGGEYRYGYQAYRGHVFVEKKKNYLFWGISIGAGALCFSALVILGVLYISTLMSQQITTASTQMVEQFITTSNSNGAAAPSEKLMAFQKGPRPGPKSCSAFMT